MPEQRSPEEIAPEIARALKNLYTVEGILFVHRVVVRAIETKRKASPKTKPDVRGREIAPALCQVAQQEFGWMSRQVLWEFGIHCTQDVVRILYGWIAADGFAKGPKDNEEHLEREIDEWFENVTRGIPHMLCPNRVFCMLGEIARDGIRDLTWQRGAA